jgi:hypothetical protein
VSVSLASLRTVEPDRPRCAWANSTPDYVAYHDEEWGTPLHGDDALFERVCLEAFQSGLSWLTILRKRPAFLLAAVVAGVLLVGPRAGLRSRWPWLGGLVALALWAPNLVWQAAHGWPQLELASAIAAGSSGTSEPWYLFVPFQLVLVSPVLVPVWITGLIRLARAPALRPWRSLAVAYGLLAVLFLVTGGKPYYLAGLFPLLLAAGAGPTRSGARRGRARAGLRAAARGR